MRYVDDINMANGGAGTVAPPPTAASSGCVCRTICTCWTLRCAIWVRILNYKVLENLYAQLKDKVEFHFLTPVKALTITDDGLYAAETDKGAFVGRKCIISVGRSGSKWMETVCEDLKIPTKSTGWTSASVWSCLPRCSPPSPTNCTRARSSIRPRSIRTRSVPSA